MHGVPLTGNDASGVGNDLNVTTATPVRSLAENNPPNQPPYRPTPPSLLRQHGAMMIKTPPMLQPRSADELRRNGMNMEKMIKKNVMAASRPGALKRGLAVVEYFKSKQQQHEASDPQAKRKKEEHGMPRSLTLAPAIPVTMPSIPTSAASAIKSPVQQKKSMMPGLVSDTTSHLSSMTAPIHSIAPKPTPKSPFQSFQSKLNPQSSKATRELVSPARTGPRIPQLAAASQSTEAAMSSSSSEQPAQVKEQQTQATSNQSSKRPVPPPVSTAESTKESKESNPTTKSPLPPSVTTVPSKPARALFSKPRAVATKSICFSTEGVVTSLDVSPDGECIVAGFSNGSIRMYEMDSSVPSDRHGYLLGHIDEQSSHQQRFSSATTNLRVKITCDGRYVFVGCRSGPRVVMSINLFNYRSEKDADDDEMEDLEKSFYSDSKLRGFSDATPYQPSNRPSYYILCGLGVGNLHLWRFTEALKGATDNEPYWQHLYSMNSGGNTVMAASFLQSPSSLTITASGNGRNLRLWTLAHQEAQEAAAEEQGHRGHHVVQSHVDIANTKDIVGLFGAYGYGISATGDAYRLHLETGARLYFEPERLNDGGTKSRRTMIMLESVVASENGNTIVAISTEGIFYYATNITQQQKGLIPLRIIGRNASENPQYKAPIKIYVPELKNQDTTSRQTMMAVATNPPNDAIGSEGFLNVDPTETFAARWMQPSRGNDCWVCGVRNLCHWPSSGNTEAAQQRSFQQQQVSKPPPPKQQERTRVSPSRSTTPTHKNDRYSPSKHVIEKQSTVTPRARVEKKRTTPNSKDRAVSSSSSSVSNQINNTIRNTSTPPAETKSPVVTHQQQQQHQELAQELERYKERYNQIKIEWQRRLKGERQMRRLWKTREAEFNQQLDDAIQQLVQAEAHITTLQEQQKDAEKRYGFEKLKAEQQHSVKQRYEQLCEHMHEKMAQLDDQKRLLEQTTRALLSEVERNVNAVKHSSVLEKNECIVCKDQAAVMAIVPCGHLCFCEQDGLAYQRKYASDKALVCPICQREWISLLRIY